MHLLMETAMGDSDEYRVLSFDEIEELKKELSVLFSRIDGLKHKLALEIKLRDAAQSINRLYTNRGREGNTDGAPKSPKKHRRSLLGSRGGGTDLLSRTDNEVVASGRKCDDLAQELWKLENRSQGLEKRLLEHTAGILQMTHKGFLMDHPRSDYLASERDNTNGDWGTQLMDGVNVFDDRSTYRAYSLFDEYGAGFENGQGGPMDRPIMPNPEFARQTQAIIETEERIENLNDRLRDLILQVNPQQNSLARASRSRSTDGSDAIEGLREQLDALDTNLTAMPGQQVAAASNLERSMFSAEEKIEDLNSYLHSVIIGAGRGPTANFPSPPQVSGKSLQAQLSYLESSLEVIDQKMQQLETGTKDSSTKLLDHQANAEQSELVLTGLWEIMVSGELEAKKGAENSHSSDPAPREQFSLQAFSAKVQSLYARATSLQEQNDILSRQIRQQRELHEKYVSGKDEQLESLVSELEHTRNLHKSSQKEVKGTQDELTFAIERLEVVRREATLREQQRGMDGSQALKVEQKARRESEEHLLAEIQAKQDALYQLEAELQELRDDAGINKAEMQGKVAESDRRIQRLNAQLADTTASKGAIETRVLSLENAIEERARELSEVQSRMKELEGEVARLNTELTVAKAELDSAYGTRAERAADIAMKPALQNEIDDLGQRNIALLQEISVLKTTQSSASSGNASIAARVDALQSELTETIAEYEVMTKASIEFEKEREQLENIVDELRDRVEVAESELSDEKVHMLGLKNAGTSSSRDSMVVGNTSTMVLKNEFKKMMRETRAEHVRALRVCSFLSSL